MSYTVYKPSNTFKKSFYKILSLVMAVAILFIPFSLALNANAAANEPQYTDLGAAKGYNLVTFGDFNNGSTDIEGKSAIGGVINCPSGFTFGNSQKMNSSEYALVWGGTRSEDFVAGNNHSDCKALIKSGLTIGNTFGSGIDYWTDTQDLKSKTGIDFSDLESELIQKSEAAAAIAMTGTVTPNGGEIIFKGDSTDYNIFTVDASILNNANGVVFDTPSTSTDIVNVIGTDVKMPVYVNDSNGNITNSYKLSHLLWNLSNAVTVQNKSSMKGTLLAPKADFTVSAWGNFEGSIIVKSFQSPQNINLEGHNYPFSGKIPVKDCSNSSSVSSTSSEASGTVSSEQSSTTSSEASSTVSSEASSTVSSEASSTASSEASSTVSSEASSTASSEASSSEASSAASSEASSTTSSEASSTVSSEASSTVSSEASSTASSEASSTASSEASSTASSEASSTVSSETSSIVSSNNSSSNSGNGGGTTSYPSGGGTPNSTTPSGIETIGEESTPLADPSSVISATPAITSSASQAMAIDENQVPLAAPKTGESTDAATILSCIAIFALGTFLVFRSKRKTNKEH